MIAEVRLEFALLLLLCLCATTAYAQHPYQRAEHSSVATRYSGPVQFRLSDYVAPTDDDNGTANAFPTDAETLDSNQESPQPRQEAAAPTESMLGTSDTNPGNPTSTTDDADARVQNIDADFCLPRIWTTAEYILWWTEGTNVPALVTTSVAGTPQNQAARLGLPTTSILFGQEELNGGARSGARFTVGSWLDLYNMYGVELTFLVLGNDETRFSASEEYEILGRPFHNTLDDEADAKLLSFPGLVQGSVNAKLESQFYTGEALLRKMAASSGWSQLDWYVGYRTAGLADELRVVEESTVLSGPIAGTELSLSDQFRTRNTFHGVDLGMRYGAILRPAIELELHGKVALGSTRTETEIAGTSATTVNGATSISDVGFLVQPTNAGTFSDDHFSTITEFGIVGKHMFRPGLSLTLGYTLFYWHDVIRSSDQVDLSINTSQFPPGVLSGEARPRIQNARTSFWAHGIRIGFEYLF